MSTTGFAPLIAAGPAAVGRGLSAADRAAAGDGARPKPDVLALERQLHRALARAGLLGEREVVVVGARRARGGPAVAAECLPERLGDARALVLRGAQRRRRRSLRLLAAAGQDQQRDQR